MTFAWVWRRCRQAVLRQPAPVVALWAAFVLLAFLAGAARLARGMADAIVPRLSDNVHVVAYLREDMTAERAGALAEVLARVPGVQGVRQVSSQEALLRLRAEAAALGGVAELLEGVEEGFLPRSLEIRLQASDGVSRRAAAFAERLRRIEGIAEVDAMEDGLARLHSVLGLLQGLFASLLALSGLAGVATLALPLLGGRPRRQEEVAVLSMLGETERRMRLPWALIGGATALSGSATGCLLLWLAHAQVTPLADALVGRWAPHSLGFLDGREIAWALFVALVLGAFFGRLAVPSSRRLHA